MEWQFKPRGYPHFDLRLGDAAIKGIVTSPERVAQHAFWPFIHFRQEVKRYKKTDEFDDRGKPIRKISKKTRDLYYSAHSDSAIFSYYSFLLSRAYEKILLDHGLSDAILAYRKFPQKKCNIHFAFEAFGHIGGNGNTVAIGFDIEAFFDNLDHQLLKEQWCNILRVDRLPADHFAVYQAVTKFSSVEHDQVYSLFCISKRYKPKLKCICSPTEFREKVVPLIKVNQNSFSIIQGSPVSALLSNIYMMPFNLAVQQECCRVGAIYRRYSDDILIICRPDIQEKLECSVLREIEKRKIRINPAKTTRSAFTHNNGELLADKPLQYLGFTFDGQRILIRSQTLGKFYRRMKQGVRSAERAAIAHKRGGRRKLFRHDLFARFTTIGGKGNDIQQRKMTFPYYVKRSSKIAKSILNENAASSVKGQFRRHRKKLEALLKKADGS